MDILYKVSGSSKAVLNFVINNDMIRPLALFVIAVSLSIYTDNLHGLPRMVLSNIIVQLVVFFIAGYMFSDSIIYAVFFALGLVFVPKLFKMSEGMSNGYIVASQCQNVKMKDLLAPFGGDLVKLQGFMKRANIPGNLHLNDDNAPLIASYLVTLGFKFADTCGVPFIDNDGLLPYPSRGIYSPYGSHVAPTQVIISK